MCFYGNFPVFGNRFSNGVSMVVTWLLTLTLLSVLLKKKNQVAVFFRAPCGMSQADMVHPLYLSRSIFLRHIAHPVCQAWICI
jgi:hypothetical protein